CQKQILCLARHPLLAAVGQAKTIKLVRGSHGESPHSLVKFRVISLSAILHTLRKASSPLPSLKFHSPFESASAPAGVLTFIALPNCRQTPLHHQHLHDGRVHAPFAAQSPRCATRKVCCAMKGAEFPRSQPFVASPDSVAGMTGWHLFVPLPLQKTPVKTYLVFRLQYKMP